MTNSLVIEFFARVLFSFTRGVTEHYDPDEPEVEIFGYIDSLSSESREWNCQPVDKGCEKKTRSCCFCLVLCGYSVSRCPSSLWNISFQAFCDSEDSSLRYISN